MKQFNILAVDDKPDNLNLLHQLLSKNGYKVRPVSDGETAIRTAKNWLPDLILLDIMMPGIDGFETCHRLKTDSETKEIPIIFLSAKDATEDIVTGFELGAADYVTKPFFHTELLSRIKTQIELRVSKQNLIKKNDQLKQLLHVLCHDLANPFYSVKTLLDLYQEDRSKADSLISVMQLAVDSGIETIDLIREIRLLEDGLMNLQIASHNLKDMICESTAILEERFREKEIVFSINIGEAIVVNVERTSFIASVINNILTNAIKFSFPGSGILISAQQVEGSIILSFRDFGVGMPAEMMADLFDMDKATSRHGTNNEKGTGFGMPLVKRFVEAYGGSIDVVSQENGHHPDHGTEIIITLLSGDLSAQ